MGRGKEPGEEKFPPQYEQRLGPAPTSAAEDGRPKNRIRYFPAGRIGGSLLPGFFNLYNEKTTKKEKNPCTKR